MKFNMNLVKIKIKNLSLNKNNYFFFESQKKCINYITKNIFFSHLKKKKKKNMPVVIEYELFEEDRKFGDANKTKRKVCSLNEASITTFLEAKYIDKPEFEPLLLSCRNAHPLDQTIRMVQETHKYFVKWNLTKQEFTSESISVSGLVEQHFPQFVPTTQVQLMKKDEKGKHVGKYAGLTSEEVIALWEESNKVPRDTGTAVHLIIECFLNGMNIAPYRKFKVIDQFLRWYQTNIVNKNLIPFRTEMMLRSDSNLKLTGTIDALFIDKTHPLPHETGGVLELIMVDWKVTPAIDEKSKFGKSGYGVCMHMEDCKKWKYAIQQHAYKYLLETFYTPFPYNGHLYEKVHIKSMYLAVFHDSLNDAFNFPIPEIGNTIQDLVEERLKLNLVNEAQLTPKGHC